MILLLLLLFILFLAKYLKLRQLLPSIDTPEVQSRAWKEMTNGSQTRITSVCRSISSDHFIRAYGNDKKADLYQPLLASLATVSGHSQKCVSHANAQEKHVSRQPSLAMKTESRIRVELTWTELKMKSKAPLCSLKSHDPSKILLLRIPESNLTPHVLIHLEKGKKGGIPSRNAAIPHWPFHIHARNVNRQRGSLHGESPSSWYQHTGYLSHVRAH